MMHKDFEKAKEALFNSKVIAFPTETVMGLGVLFDDEKAYNRLNEIKRRPEDKPYTMMFGNVNDIEKYAFLSVRDKIIIKEFMPGPLTVLLKNKTSVPNFVTHGTGIVGVRVSGLPLICNMIDTVGKPLLVPSANRSGEKPCTSYKEVMDVFGDELGFVLQKDSNNEKPSTIIDLTDKEIKIIREGSIKLDDINRRLKNMTVVVGSDHAGFEYKTEIIKYLESKNIKVIDVGTNSKESCHYPDYAAAAARDVASGKADFGVLICSSGEGISIAANKIKGVRCGLGYNDEVAALLRQHNDANMIAFGSSFMDLKDILRRIDIFLSTNFEGGRHQIRVQRIENLEK